MNHYGRIYILFFSLNDYEGKKINKPLSEFPLRQRVAKLLETAF